MKSAPPAQGKIIFMQNATPATAIIADGIKQSAQSIGWDYSSQAYDTANPATLQAALGTALQQKPTAVIVTGLPPQTYGTATLAAYKAANVPIIVGGTCLTQKWDAPIVDAGNCAQEAHVGEIIANQIIADSAGKGQVLHAFANYSPGYIEVEKKLASTLKDKCPGCQYKELPVTAAQQAGGEVGPLVVNQLRANPSIKYVVFDQAQMASGFKSALAAAGLTDIKWVGRQADKEQLDLMAAGLKTAAWTASSYPLLGASLVDATLRSLTGSPGIEADQSLPIQLITTANVKSVSSPYNEPKDGLAQYQALWKHS
jgi:hypothetical protein